MLTQSATYNSTFIFNTIFLAPACCYFMSAIVAFTLHYLYVIFFLLHNRTAMLKCKIVVLKVINFKIER